MKTKKATKAELIVAIKVIVKANRDWEKAHDREDGSADYAADVLDWSIARAAKLIKR